MLKELKINKLIRSSSNLNLKRFYTIGLYNDLKARNLISNCSSNEIESLLDKEKCVIYCGVDPTADSLHLGHLFSFFTLIRFAQFGHKAIALVKDTCGATGSIGDPSGRSTERVQMDSSVIENNQTQLKSQLESFFDIITARINVDKKDIKVRNNSEWFKNMKFIDFINHTGRYIRVSNMLAKESVKSRLNSEQGISFTEFSYQLLQAYDFWYLYHNENCKIQIGGSDQWGNIVSGIDLISKKEGKYKLGQAYGITTPLLTTSSGQKIGKSAGNAIWLDKVKTSPYQFYQYFMKVTDSDLLNFLLRFTFISPEECHQIIEDHMINPDLLNGQRILARNVTSLVHGSDAVEEVELATKALFSSDKEVLLSFNSSQLDKSFKYFKDLQTELQLGIILGNTIVQLAVSSSLCKSKGEATRLIKSGGLYLNHQRVTDPYYKINENDLLADKWGLVLRADELNNNDYEIKDETDDKVCNLGRSFLRDLKAFLDIFGILGSVYSTLHRCSFSYLLSISKKTELKTQTPCKQDR
ncbi:tyrosyl-tRNA synthetase [Neoconidiobolus thromboides FSU 785]|nr:tyrosyl-tRNA synthetase [Neoconidiobolus thromboides FSU 785]